MAAYGKGRVLRMPRKGRTIRPARRPRVIRPITYGKPKAAPAAPVAPKPPAPQPLPFDPVYQTQVANLNRQQALTQAGIQYQTGQVKQEYGFDDPSNPFNRSEMLKRAYTQGQASTTGGMASRGQLYSGALQSELDHGRFGYEQNVDSARRAYAQALQELSQQGAQSKLDYESGLALAGAERIERAPRPEDPGEPASPAAPRAGATQKGSAFKPTRKPRKITPVKGRTVKGRKPRRIRRVR